jgi:hypothetical protein
MENSVIAIRSCVITTIVYAILVPIFFEMDNVFREREYFVNLDDDHQEQQMMYDQQVVDAKCKSPCPSSAEIWIAMCA